MAPATLVSGVFVDVDIVKLQSVSESDKSQI